MLDGMLGDDSRLDEARTGVVQRYESPTDRRSTGPAIGLEHITVNRDQAFPERLEIHHGSKRTADEALYLLRSP
jgi:hypothetical protein